MAQIPKKRLREDDESDSDDENGISALSESLLRIAVKKPCKRLRTADAWVQHSDSGYESPAPTSDVDKPPAGTNAGTDTDMKTDQC